MRIIHCIVLISTALFNVLELSAAAAAEKSHVTSAQVDNAVREVEKLAQKQIQENTLPGLAIAVVFQDKVVYAKGFGVRNVRSVGNARNHNPRHVRASQRLARARGRPARRSGIFACGDFTSPSLSTSREQFSFALRLHEFWPDRSRGGGGESVRAGLGRCVQAKIVHAA